MNLYEYTPPKNNAKIMGIITCITSIGLGPLLFSLVIPNLPFKWLFQLIAIIDFTLVIFLITRFIAKSFLYSIIKVNDSDLDFTVTEITNGGKTKTTVCRIGIGGIEEIHIIDRSSKDEEQKLQEIKRNARKEGRKAFNYSTDINTPKLCIILCEECGEKFLITLAFDDTLVGYLNKNQ